MAKKKKKKENSCYTLQRAKDIRCYMNKLIKSINVLEHAGLEFRISLYEKRSVAGSSNMRNMKLY